MTLPASGPISTDQILAELRTANPNRNYPLSTMDADVLALAGKPGPPLKMPDDFWGKSSTVTFSVTAQHASESADTRFGPGSVTCTPGVTAAGGTGTKTYSWVVLSNPSGATVTLGTGPSVNVRATYRQNENGSAVVTLRCTVTDQAGQQRVVDVTGTLTWARGDL